MPKRINQPNLETNCSDSLLMIRQFWHTWSGWFFFCYWKFVKTSICLHIHKSVRLAWFPVNCLKPKLLMILYDKLCWKARAKNNIQFDPLNFKWSSNDVLCLDFAVLCGKHSCSHICAKTFNLFLTNKVILD